MNETEEMLKALGLKTMFAISDEEMPALVKEYEVFTPIAFNYVINHR